MINTILVLGAGASRPYKFPTTEDLRLDILREAQGLTNQEELKAYGISLDQVQKFHHAFESSIVYLDQFLEDRNEFLKVGKILLAKSLGKYENAQELKKVRQEDDWYRFLFDSIVNPSSGFKLTPITILTFNYDRSLDYYLYDVLQNRFNFSDEECKRQLAQIPIHHVYGSLGLLPWQVKTDSESEKVVDYGTVTKTHENLLKATKSLRIISERTSEKNIFEMLPDIYRNTQRIFFLGFGYNEINIKRLQLENFAPQKLCAGTAKNIGEVEKRKIHDFSKERLKPSNLKDAYIIEFFKNHFPLEFI